MRLKSAFLTVLLFVIFMTGCENTEVQKLPAATLRIKDVTITVELARTSPERQRGLMYRTSLGADEGMLFIWDREERRYFYMKNTTIPLSIAYISSEGVILQIEDMQPLDERSVPSHFSVRYALEVNQGAFERWGIAVGDRIIMPEEVPGVF